MSSYITPADDPVQIGKVALSIGLRENTVLSLASCFLLLLTVMLRSSFLLSLPCLGCPHPLLLSQPKLKHDLVTTTLPRQVLESMPFTEQGVLVVGLQDLCTAQTFDKAHFGICVLQ